jgi:hypothetical protein
VNFLPDNTLGRPLWLFQKLEHSQHEASLTCNNQQYKVTKGNLVYYRPLDYRIGHTNNNLMKCFTVDFFYTCPIYKNDKWDLFRHETSIFNIRENRRSISVLTSPGFILKVHQYMVIRDNGKADTRKSSFLGNVITYITVEMQP